MPVSVQNERRGSLWNTQPRAAIDFKSGLCIVKDSYLNLVIAIHKTVDGKRWSVMHLVSHQSIHNWWHTAYCAFAHQHSLVFLFLPNHLSESTFVVPAHSTPQALHFLASRRALNSTTPLRAWDAPLAWGLQVTTRLMLVDAFQGPSDVEFNAHLEAGKCCAGHRYKNEVT